VADDHVAGAPSCPACGARLDGATDVELAGHVAQPGDATVCAYCVAWLVFTPATGQAGLALRYPTDVELAVLLADPRMALARDVVVAARLRRA
jgi:hypothetical protein